MRYVMNVTVISVEQKFANGAAVKGPDDKWTVPQVNLGWFMRVTESSAIWLGNEKPDIKSGDTVRLTVEKVDAPPTVQRNTMVPK